MAHSHVADYHAAHGGGGQPRDWLRYLARFGYAAKGVVYMLVGGLAVAAAIGTGGATTGSRGALRSLTDEPLGQTILGLLAFGLAGYALWCFIQAIWDPEDEGDDAKGIAKRVGRAGAGFVHIALVIYAIGLATGTAIGGGGGAGGGQGGGTQGWVATIMSYPAGVWAVGIAGAITIVFGLQQIYKAWKVKLDEQLDLSKASPSGRKWMIRTGRLGVAARGVVFAIIGIGLVAAAWQSDPQEAMGLGQALDALSRQAYGTILLIVVAIGLFAYGIYEIIKARYRRIKTT